MLFRRNLPCRRRGAVLVEAAFAYPVLLFFVCAVIVIGLGVYRYQQVASLARVGSRYVCVHGSNYQTQTPGNPAAATDDTITTYIKDRAVGLDTTRLTVNVYLENATPTDVDWDSSTKLPTYTDGSGNTKKNTVKVVVTYTWIPELVPSALAEYRLGAIRFGTLTFTSTSKVPMSY
jgi:Flp pilus assembly protein TadG